MPDSDYSKRPTVPAAIAELDEKDRLILRLLQSQGRLTNAELSRQIGLSAPSTLQRVRKLEETGIIEGYSARLDREALGYGLMVIAMIGLALHQEKAIEEFVSAVNEIPEVLECLHVSGEHDFMLKLAVKDMSAYRDLVLDRISLIPAVGKIHSCFVLGHDKEFTGLPL